MNYLRLLSLLLLAAPLATAVAQADTRPRDTTAVRAQEDSSKTESGRNWLAGLLRRIARRSDDSTAAANAAADSASSADSATKTDAAPTTMAERLVSSRSFKSRKDSLAWESARTAAAHAEGFHLVVDIFAHQIYAIGEKGDTLRKASAATASNETLSFGGRAWHFETPRGIRKVLTKDKEPVWTPPEWHFAEVALEHHLKLKTLERGQVVHLRDGTKLKVEGDEVGIIAPGTKEFIPLVLDEHIVFDNTLFIPPGGTKHRTIQGELGHFRLYLGDGYQIHGTPYAASVGTSVTHGCVRLHDDDIEWMFQNVPVGTKVYIF